MPGFEHLDIDDGLSQNLVFSILQDYRGFMWFGTNDGLNRYDGYEFRIYNQVPGDSTSLNDNSVNILFEDSRRDLWIGAGGLNRYDRQGDRFERVFTAEDLPGNLAVPEIKAIAEDPNGDLWVIVNNVGLFRLEFPASPENAGARASHFSNYKLVGPYLLNHERDPGQEYALQAIVFAGDYLWVSYPGGVARLPADAEGRFPEPEQSRFEHFSFEFPGESAQFRSLFLAPDQSLWVGTLFGLIHLPDPGRPEAFSHYPYREGMFDNPWEGIIKKIILAPSGKLWLATYNGVLIYDPQTKKYKQLTNDPRDPKSLSFGNVSDIFLDDGQVIWLGTVGKGINKYIANPKPFAHYLGTMEHKRIYSVYDILDDLRGDIWAAINGGQLFRLDRSSGVLESIPPQKLKEWRINSMVRDQTDVLWMANDHLLTRFDPASGQMDNYEIVKPVGYSFPSDSISVVYIDDAGQLWACNTRNLRRFDPVTGSFVSYLIPDLYLEIVQDLYRDERGDFWIATLNGLLRFQLNEGEWDLFQAVPGNPDSLQQNRVKCILPDPEAPDRYLWVGTGGGGLYRMDVDRRVFKRYTRADGLPNEFIYGILADEQGQLWMSTNNGLSCFNPRSGTFTNYNVDDGLQSNEFNSRAYYRSKSGEMFFGGVNGITVFDPEAIVPNPHVPPVVLTDMELSYRSVRPGASDSPLSFAITETEEVFLSYFQNDIAFEFSALDFTLPESNQYRYRLVGYDDNWIDAGTNNRATYTNLPPGNYRFRVQGANNDGIWNEEGLSLRVVISPPLWKTWWAYLAYLLSLGGILYWAIRQVSLRSHIRDELRIQELETRKLAELDRFKSRFFTNISHEFRTPLTLLQGRIEELLKELKRNDLREKLHSMRGNAQQLMRLIEQLLDVARLEASKVTLKKKAGDIVEFVSMLVSSLQSNAQDKDLSLSFTSDPDHCIVAFDHDALQKILQNLISNAIKFTKAGGTVEVKMTTTSQLPAREGDGDDVLVAIEVADTGIGIPEQDIPHIFERFFQANSVDAVSERGFGLGLALVRELVKLHQGTISVESKEGKGTTFKLALPLPSATGDYGQPAPPIVLDERLLALESADLQDQMLAVPGEAAVLNNWSAPFGRTILVVEDHDELRHYLASVLHSEFKTIQANDGQEGLDKAFENLPDLIIADVMMPRMDGFEMSHLLKSDPRTSHIPVLLLTAKAESGDRIKGLETGADDYLVKPFTQEELRIRVANLIRNREAMKKKYAQSLLAGVESNSNPSQEESFLKSVREVIENQMENENFGVEVLAREVNMSPSQLYRKLRALVELSPVQLIQRIRLEHAASLLKQGYSVTEVTYRVGLRSPAYFSQLFKKYFGCSPREYGGAADL